LPSLSTLATRGVGACGSAGGQGPGKKRGKRLKNLYSRPGLAGSLCSKRGDLFCPGSSSDKGREMTGGVGGGVGWVVGGGWGGRNAKLPFESWAATRCRSPGGGKLKVAAAPPSKIVSTSKNFFGNMRAKRKGAAGPKCMDLNACRRRLQEKNSAERPYFNCNN